MHPLFLTLLGSFHAQQGDQPLPGFRTKATQALLIYLAADPGHPHNREKIMTLLWPGMPQKSARANLRQTLYQLRQDISDVKVENESTAVDPVIANRQEIQLNPAADVQIDIIHFEALLDQAANHDHPDLFICRECRQFFQQAVTLYQGHFLDDFYLEDSIEFEDWAQSRREYYRRRVLDSLGILTTMAIRRKEYSQAQQTAERQLQIDNLNEGAYRQLMEVFALNGRREEALATYEKCRRVLVEELGMAPTRRTTELYEKILAGDLNFYSVEQQDVRGYELKELIAEGGHGAVHRAVQPLIGREVAVKVIRRQHADDPDFIRRFEAEAQIVARLEHPYIVPLYDYWRDPNGAYLVMRYMRHGSLLSALETGAWDTAQAAGLLNQVASALTAAHQKGVVHRDIKPGNILLDEAGNAYLTDFGIAKDIHNQERITADNAVVGTLDYSSPEQILNGEITPQSDIYSLGAVIYETLTGEKPFSNDSIANLLYDHLNNPMPLVTSTRPDIPVAVDTVLQKATAKKAAERYATAEEMAEAFFAAVGVSAVGQVDESVAIQFSEVAEIYNPYKGLRAFQEADADDFFGRDTLVEQLVDRLGESADRFLAIVGPSGSGKSSAVKAGLIPALRNGALPGSEDWFTAEMVPGTHPLEELELALWSVAVDPPPSLVEPMERDARGMLRTLRRILPNGDGSQPQLLLIIDQFEELFTLVESAERREFFLDSLLAALTAPRSPLRVVISLRADFYDRPLLHHDWGRIIKDNTEIVLPLNHSELTWAVREPARRMGVRIEDELVSMIVGDVANQLGALPLLQYALTELFERREGGLIAKETYQVVGGVQGALGRRAEVIYKSLDANGRETARQLFLRLITLGEGNEDTRRRVLRMELEKLGLNSSMLESVLDEFGQARLLTFDRDPANRTPTVEVAHEALLREWSRLRGWLEQSRDDVRLQRRLAQAAKEWKTAEKDDAYLLRGSRLEQFGNWSEETQLALTQDEKNFLAASLAARTARQEVEETRRHRELETARQLAETEKARADEQAMAAGRLRQRAVMLGGALVIAAVLALAAFFFAQQSNQNAATAATSEAQAIANADLAAANEAEAITNLNLATTRESEAIMAEMNALNAQATAQAEAIIRATAEAIAIEQANLARSRELASAALLNLDEDPERSILIAMHALSQTYTSEAESALRQAIDTSRVRQTLRPPEGFPSSYVTASPDGSSLFVSGPNGATMWDIATGNLVFTHTVIDINDYPPGFVTEEWINRAAFSPDGSLLVIPNEQWAGDTPLTGTITIMETGSYEELITFPAHNNLVQIVTFNQEGTQFASAGLDGLIKIWDVEAILSNEPGQQIASLCCHDDLIWSIAYSPDESRLVSTSWDGLVNIWNLESGEKLYSIEVESRDAVFSPDGRFIVCATSDGTINFYESDQGTLYSQKTGAHSRIIEQIEFSPDGTLLGTGAQDRTAKIWEYADGQLDPAPLVLAGHKVEVGSITFIGDGSQVATGVFSSFQDRTVHIWDISPRNGDDFGLDAHTDRVSAIDFSPDGSQFATASFDGTAIVWNVSSEQPLFTLTGHTGRIMDIEFSPDGTLLATASTDRTAVIWSARSGDPIFTLVGHGEGIVGNTFEGVLEVAFSPDGSHLATAGADMTARVWDVLRGQELMVLDGFTSGLLNVVFSPDGAYIATASDATNRNGPEDGSIKIWDAVSGQELFLLPPSHGSRPWVVNFSPDGSLLVTAGSDTTAKIWLLDMQSNGGRLLTTLIGHNSTVINADFSPDGRFLATSSDEDVRFWDMMFLSALQPQSPQAEVAIPELISLPGGQGVAFSPDGNTLIAGSNDGSFRVYSLDLKDLLALARSRLTRTFTPEECRQYRIDPCPQ